jgi:hypothetical protein
VSLACTDSGKNKSACTDLNKDKSACTDQQHTKPVVNQIVGTDQCQKVRPTGFLKYKEASNVDTLEASLYSTGDQNLIFIINYFL